MHIYIYRERYGYRYIEIWRDSYRDMDTYGEIDIEVWIYIEIRRYMDREIDDADWSMHETFQINRITHRKLSEK